MTKRSWHEAEGDGSPASRKQSRPSLEADAPRRSSKEDDVNGNGANGHGVPLPQISRKIKACTACRRLKIKCQMEDSGPPCRRCSERNLDCILGKNLQAIIDEKTQYTDAVLEDLENLYATLRDVANRLGDVAPPRNLRTTALRETSPTERRPLNVLPQITQEDYGPSCDNSPKVSPEQDSDLPHVPIQSLYALTKMRALRSPDDAAAEVSDGRPPAINDFISRGVVNLDDAERLFCLYRDRLDAFMYGVGLGGGQGSTLEDLRRRSPVLTAAVLTVGALHDSRASATAVYGACSNTFRRLMEKTMFERRVDRDYLRAMCIASYWLSDMSWMLSGYAIRRAAECDLHNSYRNVIANGDEEAADGARLWYILNVCDQHLATLYGRPAIVHDDPSMQEWDGFLCSSTASSEDKRLVSQVAILGILGSIRELFGPDRGQQIPRAHIHQIGHFNKQLDQWLAQWSQVIDESYTHIGTFPRKGALLHYYFAKLYLYSHIFRGLSGEGPTMIPHYFLEGAAAAVSAAISTIDFILGDPDVSAGIVGMPSYLLCMTAFACMFLIKVAARYGEDLVDPRRVWDLTTALVAQFRSLPAGRWHLANLMAPGLERMAASLQPGDAPMMPANGVNGSFDMSLQTGVENPLTGMEGDLFFDYDMNFGLSPVFRLDQGMTATAAPTPAFQNGYTNTQQM